MKAAERLNRICVSPKCIHCFLCDAFVSTVRTACAWQASLGYGSPCDAGMLHEMIRSANAAHEQINSFVAKPHRSPLCPNQHNKGDEHAIVHTEHNTTVNSEYTRNRMNRVPWYEIQLAMRGDGRQITSSFFLSLFVGKEYRKLFCHMRFVVESYRSRFCFSFSYSKSGETRITYIHSKSLSIDRKNSATHISCEEFCCFASGMRFSRSEAANQQI